MKLAYDWSRRGRCALINNGMTFPLQILLVSGVAGALSAMAASGPDTGPDPERLLNHVRVLASDEYEGRAPGTAGEEHAVTYLIEQFKALGLEPGNPDGTFFQSVPLMGITSEAQGAYRAGDRVFPLVLPDQCVLGSRRFVPEVRVTDSEMVFVGYGVVAPEYGWDDFKGVEVRGKTMLVLVGDPPVPDPEHPGNLEGRMFKGRATTAEEQGLLGARHYAAHPLVPLDRTLALLNMDGMNPWGRTRDVCVIGMGNSTLEDLRLLMAVGRKVADGDHRPEWRAGAEFKRRQGVSDR